MAPVPQRPPPAPLIQRPLLAPSFTPIQPTSLIPRKLFFQLLAGTVCIFILGVFIWKFPRFLRFFTKSRVVGGGKKTTSRYMKTWYGWASPERHAARKRPVKICMAKLRSWISWRSSRADFEWVFWDPDPKELGTYQQRTQREPRRTTRQGFATSDGMWNFMTPSNPSSITTNGLGTPSFTFATGALPPPSSTQSTPFRGSFRTSISAQEDIRSRTGFSTLPRLRRARVSDSLGSGTSSNSTAFPQNDFTSSPHLPFPRNSGRVPLTPLNHTELAPYSHSMPCLSHSKRLPLYPEARSIKTTGSKDVSSDDSVSNMMPIFRRSRKYQVWSARLGLQTLNGLGYSTHTLPKGPPGSPRTAILGSLSIDSTGLQRACQGVEWTSSSGRSDLSLRGSEQQHSPGQPASFAELKRHAYTQHHCHSLPRFHPHSKASRSPVVAWHGPLLKIGPTSTKDENQDKGRTRCKPEQFRPKWAGHFIVPVQNWSDWEVRLIDNLHRKLEWVANQFTPGIRPFHFALLANHWLNRETWIVYDPISRVNLDNRRLWGDPRFNVPYPLPPPTNSPAPKYPKSNRRLAQTPHINSWRVAVNRNRKASGLKSLIRRVELFESSVEDPPDGKIDTACWVLRKPPQGFAPSTRHEEQYYEGGAGWQEKYSDWQRIRRGYRIRKAIYEGRVNRTRVKEMAYAISRSYRQVSSRFGQSVAGRGGHCQEHSTGETV